MSPKPPIVLVLGALAVASCSGPGPVPTSAPPPVRVVAAGTWTQADVAFMQGMIHHHGQALDMTALVPERSTSASLRTMAARIEATQLDEIRRMRQWLEVRGETAPDPAAYRGHAAHEAHMPGMLTPEQMQRLTAASGTGFDRLFLEYMIQHHEGALTMVSELQSAGGGVEGEVYILASDVDADQRAEIARMRSMLTVLQRGSE